jgi:hypothetical protein
MGHCDPNCPNPTERHDRNALIQEILRVRDVARRADAIDKLALARKVKHLGKEYGRASATIRRLRGELAITALDDAARQETEWPWMRDRSAADSDTDPLEEARGWARHGYEIGQRSCTWSDQGVAPKWLTGWHKPEALADPKVTS